MLCTYTLYEPVVYILNRRLNVEVISFHQIHFNIKKTIVLNLSMRYIDVTI